MRKINQHLFQRKAPATKLLIQIGIGPVTGNIIAKNREIETENETDTTEKEIAKDIATRKIETEPPEKETI